MESVKAIARAMVAARAEGRMQDHESLSLRLEAMCAHLPPPPQLPTCRECGGAGRVGGLGSPYEERCSACRGTGRQ